MSEFKFEIKLRRKNVPDAELLEDIKSVAEKLGLVSLTAVQYGELGNFGTTTILRRFGSWHQALESAGLTIVHNVNINEDALLENIADVWRNLGRQPFGREMEKSAGFSKYSLGTYESRFGSWNKTLERFIEYIKNSDTANPASKGPTKKTEKIVQRNSTLRKINWRQRAVVLIRDNCICKMCGASPAKNPEVVLHVDHIIPWSKGGETKIYNLQTLCSVCNIGKSDVM